MAKCKALMGSAVKGLKRCRHLGGASSGCCLPQWLRGLLPANYTNDTYLLTYLLTLYKVTCRLNTCIVFAVRMMATYI